MYNIHSSHTNILLPIYNPPPPPPTGTVKKILVSISSAKTETARDKAYDPLMEIVTYVQFANDELDFGMGSSHCLLPTAYLSVCVYHSSSYLYYWVYFLCILLHVSLRITFYTQYLYVSSPTTVYHYHYLPTYYYYYYYYCYYVYVYVVMCSYQLVKHVFHHPLSSHGSHV